MDRRDIPLTVRTLSLTQPQLAQMIVHAGAQLPCEACGLLAGKGSSVESVLPVANQARSPARFVMDPLGQLQAFEWIDSQGLDLVGIFHSHPAGPETVSPTDIADSAYAVVNVVLSRVNGTWRARGFWIEDGRYEEVALEIS